MREWIGGAYGLPVRPRLDRVEQVKFGTTMATLVSFSHPSVPSAQNWGLNERTPYLLETVVPTIARVVNRPTVPQPVPDVADSLGSRPKLSAVLTLVGVATVLAGAVCGVKVLVRCASSSGRSG